MPARLLRFSKAVVLKLIPIGFLLFGLWFFFDSLSHNTLAEIFTSISKMDSWNVAGAALLTCLSFVLLMATEVMAFRNLGEKHVDFKNILKISFAAFGMSNTLPFAGVAATTIRFRLYSMFRVPTENIIGVIAFCSLAVWLGFLFLIGSALLLTDLTPLQGLQFPRFGYYALGFLAASVAIFYLILSARKTHFKIFKYSIHVPAPKFALAQIGFASTDWVITGLVLYLLLPNHVETSYQLFFLVFLLSQVLSLVVHVPAGLGILEFLILAILVHEKQLPSDITAALLVYRFVYYLVPFSISLFFLIKVELEQSRSLFLAAAKRFKALVFSYAPAGAALSVFFSGIVLLLSGATPEIPARMDILAGAVSERLIAFSHFFASLIGVCMLVLANALRKRSSSAHLATVCLASVAIVLCILKGIDFEEAVLLSTFVLMLLLTREEFFRKSSLFTETLTLPWISSIGLIASGVFIYTASTLELFSGKYFEWQMVVDKVESNRMLQANFGALVLVFFFFFWRLMAPGKRPKPPRRTILPKEVHELVLQSNDTNAFLVYAGDKTIFVGKGIKNFLMYSIQGQSWISFGNPIGDQQATKEVVSDFMKISDEYGCWPVFYQISHHHLGCFVDLGFRIIKIGEEGRVDLSQFSLEGRDKKSQRNTMSRIEREGFEFSIVEKDRFFEIDTELERISNEWLAKNQLREKGFSIGFFDRNYLQQFETAILKKNGRIVAFANIWQCTDKNELSVDLMRSNSEAPSGAMEYIFTQLMLWGKNQGFKEFNLGMAPLAGLEQTPSPRTWQNLGSIAFEFGEYFYNFRGVKAFKEKFSPSWHSKYIAFPQGASLTAVMTDIARLVSRPGKNLISQVEPASQQAPSLRPQTAIPEPQASSRKPDRAA